ncbi:uncharacterized protein LOC106518452 [Austrofundulus limnaeus]|uniref:Uncharacterized protein LOC106518452 n=1 Tax=Austrofundulus limnaeus TaxID=52670 RepID=A0A2I4BBR6_AUSLI|nr:PREDICTED: uncharacterized protein LOC106518452 [Austrofundulus limnaeus]
MTFYVSRIMSQQRLRSNFEMAELDNSQEEMSFKWTKEKTEEFIRLRASKEALFTGAKHSASVAWKAILEQMKIDKLVTTVQAKKKWDNLKKRYKKCKYPGSGEGVAGKPTVETWPWFVLTDEALRRKPSMKPPVLLSSIPDDRPGPSTAVGSQQAEDEEDERTTGPPARKRPRRNGRDDELIDLIKEDIRLQREAEERRAQEGREYMDRLFSLLETIAKK